MNPWDKPCTKCGQPLKQGEPCQIVFTTEGAQFNTCVDCLGGRDKVMAWIKPAEKVCTCGMLAGFGVVCQVHAATPLGDMVDIPADGISSVIVKPAGIATLPDVRLKWKNERPVTECELSFKHADGDALIVVCIRNGELALKHLRVSGSGEKNMNVGAGFKPI